VNITGMRGDIAAAGALLIEDAAQGAGATLRGRVAGSLGPVSVLSFGRGKGTTGGRGGAVLIRERHASLDGLREGSLGPGGRGWASLAAAAAQAVLGHPSVYGLPAAVPFLRLGETVYHGARHPAALPRSAVGLLPSSLELEAGELGKRRRNAARLLERIGDSGVLTPIRPLDAAAPGYLRLPVLGSTPLPTGRRSPGRRLGVMRGYPTTLGNLRGFRSRVRNAERRFPGAEELVARLVTLPTHGRMAEADLGRLESWISRPG
jgi:dTDP-4-amino-4,6-dideoxygalactose transaminase